MTIPPAPSQEAIAAIPAVSLHEHWEALRNADRRFLEERDRRLTEVATEREKALAIKEKADRDALGLAREIQQYKDEKANDLRSQIESERGRYPTKEEMAALSEKFEQQIKPIADYVATQQGAKKNAVDSQTLLFATIGIMIAIVGIASRFIN